MNTQQVCRRCDVPMENMSNQPILSRIRPEHIFQCPVCYKRVMVYRTYTEPLKIWNDEIHNVPDVATYVEKRAKEKGVDLLPAPPYTWVEEVVSS